MYDLYVIDDGLRVSLAGVPVMELTGDDAALVHRVWRELGPWRGDDFLHGLLVGAALLLSTTKQWVEFRDA